MALLAVAPSPGLAAGLAVFFLAFYFVLYPFVEYFRDPKRLRRFPSMTPLAGVYNFPFMLESSRGFRSAKLAELHKTQPVIRTGPNSLSYSDVRAIRPIYGHNTKCLKDGQYSVTAGSHFHLADVIDRGEHARKRKVLAAAYALKNLEGWEDKVSDKVRRVIAQFDKRCTAPLPEGVRVPAKDDLTVDYRAWTNYFSIDAIADIGLSERMGFLDRGNDRCLSERPDGTTYEVNFRECIYGNAHKQSILVWSYDWYKILDRLVDVFPSWRKMSVQAAGWEGSYRHLATQRMKRYQAGEKLDDFFSALMEDKDGTSHNLDWGEVLAEISIMMNAGSVTTAIAMTNVLYHLLKHPHVMQKLREELDAALDPEDVIAPYQKVKNLPYLRAVLDESLRIFPPTTHGLPREVPSEGLEICDEFIPGGTTVAMSAFVVHHNESVFKEPEKFIPERWLGEEGKKLQSYFIAFSTGARGCIGRNITYLEQTVLLASVLRRYEFALPYPEWELKRTETFNLHPSDMPVKVWRRGVEAAG